MVLSDIVIILCRASEPGNVGAVCRVMKNMGLSQLRIAGTEPLTEEPLLARAVHAEDIWHNARFFDTLADAAADCSLVVGTTRRRGKNRKNATMEPRALAEWLARESTAVRTGAPLALVFGNERTGLEDEEMNLCNIASHIPVSKACPSLNLSHAVQIYAYELFLAFGGDADDGIGGASGNGGGDADGGTLGSDAGGGSRDATHTTVKGEWVPLERTAVDALTADITGSLGELGFYKQQGKIDQARFVRDLICRAALTEREGQYLKTIFAKAAGLVKRRGGESSINNAIVVLCGNIGAGKTYTANKIAEQYESILFSIDKIMLTLFGEIDGRELFIEKFKLVEEIIYEIINDILENTNGNIIIDFCPNRKEFKKRFEKYNLVFVYINTPDDIRWERVKKRNEENNPYDYKFDKETFDYLSSLFEEFSEDEEYIEYENIEKLIEELKSCISLHPR